MIFQEEREIELKSGRDRDNKIMSDMLGELARGTRDARTGLWSAMQATAYLSQNRGIALGIEKPQVINNVILSY